MYPAETGNKRIKLLSLLGEENCAGCYYCNACSSCDTLNAGVRRALLGGGSGVCGSLGVNCSCGVVISSGSLSSVIGIYIACAVEGNDNIAGSVIAGKIGNGHVEHCSAPLLDTNLSVAALNGSYIIDAVAVVESNGAGVSQVAGLNELNGLVSSESLKAEILVENAPVLVGRPVVVCGSSGSRAAGSDDSAAERTVPPVRIGGSNRYGDGSNGSKVDTVVNARVACCLDRKSTRLNSSHAT